MKSRSFIIVLIVLVVIGSGSMYSCVLVTDPHDKFNKIKRELYVKGNKASVNLELDKDVYLLQVRHETARDRHQETYFNAMKLTANTFPCTRISDNIECSYIHIPSEIVNQGRNAIDVTYTGNPPPKIQIRLTNYRKKISDEIYILFSDSSHVRTSKILSIDLRTAGILILLFSIMVYLQVRCVPAGENRLSSLSRIYLLVLLCIAPALSCLGRIGSCFGYRIAVTPFRFWSFVAILVAPFFAMIIGSRKSGIDNLLITERKFSLPLATFFVIMIVLVSLWAYWPSFNHLFRHDEWFLFFSSKEETPNLRFILNHVDWQLRLPYDRLIFRPIHHMMLAINRVAFDTNYVGPHILTFAIHIVVTLSLWGLMWLYSPRWISGVFALFFSVLAAATDSVMLPHFCAYIIITLLTMLAIITFRKTVFNQMSAVKGFGLTSFLLFLNMLTTEIAFLMPFVFFLSYWIIFRNRGESMRKQKDLSSLLILFLPILLWLILFSIHLYLAYPDLKMTSQSRMISLWIPFVNVGRFMLMLLSGTFLPIFSQMIYGDKVYLKVFGVGFVVLVAVMALLNRLGGTIFKNISREMVFWLLLLFSIVIVFCFGRASYINACLNNYELPSSYLYCPCALIVVALYACFDFDKIVQGGKWGLPLLLVLGLFIISHAITIHRSAVEIERQTASLKKYFDSVKDFVAAHRHEPDFSFKMIDRPPQIQVFTWYHETCIDGLFDRYINNEKPKYLLEYDYITENLQYSLYDRIPKPTLCSTPTPSTPEGADYINSIGMPFKKVPGLRCDFLLGMFEVTQKQWKEIMGFNPSGFKDDNHPVENVSYVMVQKFIACLNEMEVDGFYRLPTEREYVYLVRLFESNHSNKDNVFNEYAWLEDNSERRTHAAGELAPMLPGVYDLVGNVWEWTQNPIDYDSVVKPLDNNPRICFGGSWRDDVASLHDVKTNYPPDFHYQHLGFRLVRQTDETGAERQAGL